MTGWQKVLSLRILFSRCPFLQCPQTHITNSKVNLSEPPSTSILNTSSCGALSGLLVLSLRCCHFLAMWRGKPVTQRFSVMCFLSQNILIPVRIRIHLLLHFLVSTESCIEWRAQASRSLRALPYMCGTEQCFILVSSVLSKSRWNTQSALPNARMWLDITVFYPCPFLAWHIWDAL